MPGPSRERGRIGMRDQGHRSHPLSFISDPSSLVAAEGRAVPSVVIAFRCHLFTNTGELQAQGPSDGAMLDGYFGYPPGMVTLA